MDLAEPKKQNYLTGAAILAATVALTKVVGAIYKIPLFNLLGDAGAGHFNVMYNIYTLILTFSTAGVPVALSRLISEARATSRPMQVRRIYSTGYMVFGLIGLVGMTVMLVFAPQLAGLMNDPLVATGVRCLAPAIFFACIVSVLRGWSQGHGNMLPTAVSQIMEVMCKLIFGLAIAWGLKRMGMGNEIIAAGAIVGVTIGLGLAIPVLWCMCRRIARNTPMTLNLDRPEPYLTTAGKILTVSIPITLSSSVLNIINIIDTSLVRGQLANGAGLPAERVDVLYGVYSKGMTLFSFTSSFITPIAVSVVPVIAAALARKNAQEARGAVESSMKLTNLLAMPAAVGLTVLAEPIFTVIFPGSDSHGPALLQVLGIASFFVCAYVITNAILQASGYERLALLALPIGGVVKIAVNYVLVGSPAVNISGAPVGTLLCYALVTLINVIFIAVKLPERPNYLKITLRPLICSLLMGGAAWGIYGLCDKFIPLAQGRLRGVVCLGIAVVAAVAVYGVLIIALRAVTKEDILLLPKGEKLAKMLKIR